MTAIILGIILLVFPISNVPSMIKNKKKNNRYFLDDPRILVSKNSNMGNNLNMQNKYAFFLYIFNCRLKYIKKKLFLSKCW